MLESYKLIMTVIYFHFTDINVLKTQKCQTITKCSTNNEREFNLLFENHPKINGKLMALARPHWKPPKGFWHSHTFNRIHFHMVHKVGADVFFSLFSLHAWHNWKYCVNVSVKWTRNQNFPLPISLFLFLSLSPFGSLLWLTIGKQLEMRNGQWQTWFPW